MNDPTSTVPSPAEGVMDTNSSEMPDTIQCNSVCSTSAPSQQYVPLSICVSVPSVELTPTEAIENAFRQSRTSNLKRFGDELYSATSVAQQHYAHARFELQDSFRSAARKTALADYAWGSHKEIGEDFDVDAYIEAAKGIDKKLYDSLCEKATRIWPSDKNYIPNAEEQILLESISNNRDAFKRTSHETNHSTRDIKDLIHSHYIIERRLETTLGFSLAKRGLFHKEDCPTATDPTQEAWYVPYDRASRFDYYLVNRGCDEPTVCKQYDDLLKATYIAQTKVDGDYTLNPSMDPNDPELVDRECKRASWDCQKESNKPTSSSSPTAFTQS